MSIERRHKDLTAAMARTKFDPVRDIGDLSGKVFLVTGGMDIPCYNTWSGDHGY